MSVTLMLLLVGAALSGPIWFSLGWLTRALKRPSSRRASR